MKITDVKSTTVKTYRLTVEDGEVRSQPHSRSGREYRVERIVVTKKDGNVSRVEIQGSVLKKDGTASLNDAHESLWSQRDWPQWLHGVIGGLA